MRKLLALPMFLSVSLAGGGLALAAPDNPKCTPIGDYDKVKEKDAAGKEFDDLVDAANHLIDMGPAAGVNGGRVVAQGTPPEVQANPRSLTGDYLAGRNLSSNGIPEDFHPPGLSFGHVRSALSFRC